MATAFTKRFEKNLSLGKLQAINSIKKANTRFETSRRSFEENLNPLIETKTPKIKESLKSTRKDVKIEVAPDAHFLPNIILSPSQVSTNMQPTPK